MANIVCYGSDGSILSHYTQWDVNQELIIKGVDTSSAPDFHFSNNLIKDTYVIKSKISGTGLIANVPDELLQYSASVVAHICYKDGTTEYTVRIPVMPRKKPDNYVYTDTESGSGSSSSGQVSIVDNLVTNDSRKALSAAQGVVIKTRLDELELEIDNIDVSDQISDALQIAKDSGEFDGRGIKSIQKTSGNGAAGTTDIYTITFSDDTTFTFNVYNGSNGVGGGSTGDGENGATFIPHVDSSGNLSWSNDKGLPNPDSVNIKGEDGDPGRGIVSITKTAGNGAPGSTDTYTILYTDNTTSIFYVYNGADGTGGDGSSVAGFTFIPHIDSLGNISWTNNGGLENPETVNIKGEPGTTPERGINYWTEEDIAEIKSYVDSAILEGEW